MTDEYKDFQGNKANTAGAAPQEEIVEPKIMCYVSKEMVPLSKTVEVEYSHGKKFRVLPKYIKFRDESAS